MSGKVSKQLVLTEVTRLLASEEGVLTLLTGALAISDFDSLEMALEEALKAYNGNRSYFRALIHRHQQSR